MAYLASVRPLERYHRGNVEENFYFIMSADSPSELSCVISRSAPASPSHVGISGLMTPECLSREASPGPESYPDSSVPSPAGQLATSQSAPGSPGHPYTSSQSTHKGRLMQTIITNGVSGDTGREGEEFFSLSLSK